MIVMLEEAEAWSLMMLISAITVDNAGLSEAGKDAVRRWRSDRNESTEALARLTEDLNVALNQHIDAKFMRRVKKKGGWYETVKR